MYKLVVVEDEKEVRGRLTGIINKSHTKFDLVAEYENGIDAFNGIVSDQPDLVFTDIRIPFINGIELSRKLREALPQVKIVIIMGDSDIDCAKDAANIGVQGFISKPINQRDVDDLLKKAEAAMDAENVTVSSLTRLEAFYKSSIPIIREHNLYKLSTMSSVDPPGSGDA